MVNVGGAVISLLNRKLLRDVIRMRSQAFAIVLVVACGIAQLTTNVTAFRALQNAQASYYREYRFADVFVPVKHAPEWIVSQIQAVPGVERTETRIVRDLILDVPGLDEPATGRVVSIPGDRQPALNQLYIRRGRYVEPRNFDEVLVSESFADANHLSVGASISAVINGKLRKLQIVGVALSPEFIYQIKPGDLFPDNRRFGILWMSRTALSAAFDMEAAFDDVVVSLKRGASERMVIDELDRILRPYGGYGAYGRQNQVSHAFITDEIRQNRVFGLIMPSIFLGLAGFLIATVMMRMVSLQREQIGVLKAFGFADGVISIHYLKLALVIITAGWFLGITLGIWWAGVVSDMYRHFYYFPSLRFSLEADTLVLTYAVVAVTAVAGCLRAVRKASLLPPAEAMRSDAPVSFRSGLLERLRLFRWMSLNGRMIFRNIARYPVKAALSILGIALGTSVLLVGYYFQDALHYMADVQFRAVQRETEMVTFQSPQNHFALNELTRLPGVLRVEPVRIVPARLRNGYRVRRIGLFGMEVNGELRRLVSQDGRHHQLPLSGVVLTKKLAEILDVREGEDIVVEVIEGRRPEKTLTVTGVVDELMGLSAYINIRDLNAMMLEPPVISGAFLLVDSRQEHALESQLKHSTAITSVSSRKAAVKSFEDTLAQTSGNFAYIFILFATLIVFASVYNAGRIALSERTRELASLCVLGFSRAEVALVVIGEQAVLTAVAIPIGIAIGYLIASWLSWVYALELFRIPLIITRASYGATVFSATSAALVSALVVLRRIVRLNLVAAIKTAE
jgi:putative ABC transport system permease protein